MTPRRLSLTEIEQDKQKEVSRHLIRDCRLIVPIHRLIALLLTLSLAATPLVTACGNFSKPDPQAAAAYVEQGNTLYNQKKLDEAIDTYRQAIKLDPNFANAYNGLGDALYDKKKLDEAIAAYRQAVKLDPNYATAYYNLGWPLYDQKKLDEAIAAYRQAIKLDPNFAYAYRGLGSALRIQKKLDEAIDAYRQAIKLDPNYANAYIGLGNALSDQKKLDEAIDAYRQAIKLDPNNANAYYNLGIALSDQKKLDEAIDAYRQAIKLDPNDAYAYIGLGNALSDQKKLDEAIAAYRKALSLPENKSGTSTTAHTLAHNNLGLTLQDQGKLDEAIQEFQQAIQLDPDYDIAQNNLKEAQRQLALRKTPVVVERIPSLQEEPLVPMLRSVVKVIAKIPTGNSVGTGWVVKQQGNRAWIVTNRHVLQNPEGAKQPSEDIKVEFYSDPLPNQVRRQKPAQLVQITADDDELDLALLEVTDLPADIKPLPMSSTPVSRGASIRVIGHPSSGIDWTVESGEISNMTSQKLQLSKATLSRGNSGGPVLDKDNRVVGIVLETFTPIQPGDTAGFGFAYRTNLIQDKLKTWGML